MKPRNLLILFLLVAGLGAYIYFVERDLPSSEERATRSKQLFAGLESDDLVGVTLESEGQSVRLERQGEGDDAEWTLTGPAEIAPARADASAVDSLVDALGELAWSRRLEDGDRAATGLDAPRARAVLAYADGGEKTLEIGAEVPASTQVLAALAGDDTLYVIPGTVVAQLQRPAGNWRDRQLFRGDRDDIHGLTLTSSEGSEVALSRRGERFWLDRPVQDRADRERLDSLLSDLTLLTVERFIDTPAASAAPHEEGGENPRGLEPSRGSVVLTDEAGDELLRLAIGAESGGSRAASGSDGLAADGTISHYARLGERTLVIRSSLPSLLGGTADSWQDHHLTGWRSFQIDRATFTDAGGETVLERSDTDWLRNGERLSYTPVSELLAAVTEAQAERVLDSPAPTGEPRLTIAFAGEDGEQSLALYGGGGALQASAGDRTVVLELAESVAQGIFDRLEEVRAAEPVVEEEETKDSAG
ncbi:MAG: DUF4340 domain-containing protein [Acidobacteriota bacterium]